MLFFGWSLITILVLYWIENGIVGFWNVPKIALAQGSIIPRLPDMPASAALAATRNADDALALQAAWRRAQALRDEAIAQGRPASSAAGLALGRLQLIPRAGLAIFFLVHYGMFWLVHGVFVFALPMIGDVVAGPLAAGAGCEIPIFPEPGEIEGIVDAACASSPFGELAWGSVLIGATALFLSHGASFLLNYIGNGEYQRTSPGSQMAAPYGRVIVLHLTIILGAFAIAFVGAPIGALLILVGLKTVFDLGLHRREHRATGP